MLPEEQLSRLTRYETLFELSSEINAATEIGEVGRLMASRLKYVANVYSWRYFRLDQKEPLGSREGQNAFLIDGYRGQATTRNIDCNGMCALELELWEARTARFLDGDDLEQAKLALPEHLKRKDIVQIYACPGLTGDGLHSMLLFASKKHPFNELDIRFLGFASQFFQDKVQLLWEEKKLRDMEKAYLGQEMMLRQSEKLATLGKLSAGVAHELNNPAAAAQRSAAQLSQELDRLEQAQRQLAGAGLSEQQNDQLEKLLQVSKRVRNGAMELDTLQRSDLEARLEAWLEERQVDAPWDYAPELAAQGFDVDQLSQYTLDLSGEQLVAVVRVLSSAHSARALSEEVRTASGRVSEVVKALKSYSYLDQAPIQSIDVHEGLDDTLVILRSKLDQGIELRRDYEPGLPHIQAYGSQLNQVWTNLIDNAISAMGGTGKLVVRTRLEDPWVVVEIADDGPGIPPNIQPKLFDPFFTTKPPGEGTGLGLSICHNIVVRKHHGAIEVRSKAGETAFVVRLPTAGDDIQMPETQSP